MRRKLVKQGYNALTVTLPAEWLRRFNLKVGDEVEIEERRGKLEINAEKEKATKKTELDISELNDTLVWTYVIAAYRKGSDEILLKLKKEQTALIQKVVDALLGLAIVEMSENSCRIKDITGTTADEKEFSNILRRIFFLLEGIAESVIEAVKKDDRQALKNMEYQDYNINKFSNFCLRMLNKKYFENFDTALTHYIISELENLGDEYARLAIDVASLKSNLKKSLSQELIKLFEEVNSLLPLFEKIYYKFDNNKVIELIEKKNAINKKITSLFIKSSSIETVFLYHLSKITHLIINLLERQIMASI